MESRGRDLGAPEAKLTVAGREYNLVFNNMAYRIAEDIYEDKYGRDVGIYKIMDELAVPKHRAVMAVMYAAARAGGCTVSWEDFDRDFKLTDISTVAARLQEGVLASMPPSEGAEKNA